MMSDSISVGRGPSPVHPDRSQKSLFELESLAQEWDRELASRALDELFGLTHQYRASSAYWDLLQFIARFRSYSPYNAMLVRMQMPGAVFVASPTRWMNEYGRRVKPGARPLVILQPRGPVLFVFDVSDTEPAPGALPLPPEVEQPFEVRGGVVGPQLERTIENAKRDGIDVYAQKAGSQSAGVIQVARSGAYLRFPRRLRPKPEYIDVPLRYELLLNSEHSREAKYATLVHELAHLYCGHLGTPDAEWWPDRRWVPDDIAEFEAESVCYLVCRRLGIDTQSEKYLAGYTAGHGDTPQISLECVMKAAGLIEQMGRERLKPR